MPELYLTAKRLLSHLMAHPPGQQQDAQPPKKKAKKAAAPPPTPPAPKPRPLRFSDLHGDVDAGSDEQLQIDSASMTLHLVSDLTTISSDLPSLIEIITPLLQTLTIPSDAAEALPACLHELHAKCVETVASHLKRAVESRVPLRMQHQPAVAIKQYNPSFDDDFQPDVSMDPDRERAEKQKLMRKTKKEKKGAMRELKKDAAFIAREREAEKSKTTQYLEERGKRALRLMEEQEHSMKEMRKERRKLSKKEA